MVWQGLMDKWALPVIYSTTSISTFHEWNFGFLEIDIWEEIDDTLQARDDKRENYFDGKMYREMLLA